MTQRQSRRSIIQRSAIALVVTALANAGCAMLTPYQEPVPAQPIVVGEGQTLAVDRLIVLFDASGSIHYRKEFPNEKAWVETFVQGMPDGPYEATIRSFGGDRRSGGALAPFDREQLAAAAHDLEYIGEDTPLDAVLLELAEQLQTAEGTTAIVIVTDGLANPQVYGGPADPALVASRTLVNINPGTVCYHTVLAGDDTGGAALLRSIAAVTPCGSFQASNGFSDATRIARFERSVFVATAAVPPPVAAAPIDRDRDGIIGIADRCPNTPPGAAVGIRGCWLLRARFASESAELPGGGSGAIAEVATVMTDNPDIRIQIAGYTDSSGPATYNQSLSERRARHVKAQLIDAGIDASRLEAVGHGEANPVADNETPVGREENRRIEFTVLG
jgi:OOP family OmpA-OmpF porin